VHAQQDARRRHRHRHHHGHHHGDRAASSLQARNHDDEQRDTQRGRPCGVPGREAEPLGGRQPGNEIGPGPRQNVFESSLPAQGDDSDDHEVGGVPAVAAQEEHDGHHCCEHGDRHRAAEIGDRDERHDRARPAVDRGMSGENRPDVRADQRGPSGCHHARQQCQGGGEGADARPDRSSGGESGGCGGHTPVSSCRAAHRGEVDPVPPTPTPSFPSLSFPKRPKRSSWRRPSSRCPLS